MFFFFFLCVCLLKHFGRTHTHLLTSQYSTHYVHRQVYPFSLLDKQINTIYWCYHPHFENCPDIKSFHIPLIFSTFFFLLLPIIIFFIFTINTIILYIFLYLLSIIPYYLYNNNNNNISQQ